jgi:hypothetical protein
VAESRILGTWFTAEAERRNGDLDAAAREAGVALHAARDFGHVWLQASLLVYLEDITRENRYADRRRDLLGPVAEKLGDDDAARLRAAWRI